MPNEDLRRRVERLAQEIDEYREKLRRAVAEARKLQEQIERERADAPQPKPPSPPKGARRG